MFVNSRPVNTLVANFKLSTWWYRFEQWYAIVIHYIAFHYLDIIIINNIESIDKNKNKQDMEGSTYFFLFSKFIFFQGNAFSLKLI